MKHWWSEPIKALQRWMRQPVTELTRTQRTVRWWLDLGRHCWFELRHDRAGQMSAALTFHTLFSLLPTLVIMLVVLASFVEADQREAFQDTVTSWLIKPLEEEPRRGENVIPMEQADDAQVDEQTVPPDADDPGDPGGPDAAAGDAGGNDAQGNGGDDATAAPPGGPPGSLDREGPAFREVRERADEAERRRVFESTRAAIRTTLDELFDDLEKVNFTGIGVVGVLLFVFASTGLLTTIEKSFNAIYGVSRDRPLYLRLPLYYTVITLGPLVVIAGQIGQERMVEMVRASEWTSWLAGPLVVLTPLITTWMVLSLLYMLLPNTRVQKRAAAVGGFVAAALWVAAIELLTWYINRATTASFYGALYGALALLPLFLLWLWVTWLIALFGLELTYALQAMHGRRFKHLRYKQMQEMVIDPTWLIPLATHIHSAFERGETVDVDQLSRRLNLPIRTVRKLLDALQEARLVHRIDGGADEEQITYALARPASNITVADLLNVAETMLPEPERTQHDPAWQIVRELHGRWQTTGKQFTLADIAAGRTTPQS